MAIRLSPKVEETFHVLRERISEMPVGVPLPAFSDLKDEMNVGQLTIQRAYDMLEAQGYIVRKVGKGVFVADRTQTGEFAIVVKPGLFRPNSSGYYPLASALLMEMLHESRPACSTSIRIGRNMDVTDGHAFAASLDLLDPSILPRLRGVFTFHPLYDVWNTLESAGVPVVGLYDADLYNHATNFVWFDYQAGLVIPAVHELANRGCKKIGLVCPDSAVSDSMAIFKNSCQASGLEIIDLPIIDVNRGTYSWQGYELIMQMWSQGVRPDGLVILDEIHARGVCAACLKLGLSVPEDILLVSQAMRGAESYPGVNIIRIEFDPMEQIRLAVDMMLTLVEGAQPEHQHIRLLGRIMTS